MSIFDKVELERLLNNLYSGAVNPSRLPVDLYKATLDTLLKAVYKGFGNTTSELIDGSPEMDLLKHYEYNIAIFSGAKTLRQVEDMSALVFTENGYKRDFSEFKRIITGDQFHEGVFSKYNKTYLKTEFNTAVSTAQMGREWLQIEDDAEVFPYLKYITAHDERVRHNHQELDGVIRPVGDDFWNTHVPPNGFNCRCRLMQLNPDDDVFSVTPDDVVKNLPKADSQLFQTNPAKSGFIFNESIHPYTKNINERFKVSASQNFGLPTPPKPAPLKPRKKIEVPKDKKKK
jgi:SPP1 gp7 family putative phage head morphogenesis protein